MTTSAVDARRLTKRFGARTAVEDVSFTVGPGEVLGLLGPNGAGKTTTIRLLTTVLTPTTGEFTVAGIPSDQPERIRARIGVLPESAGYPAHQTGAEFLRYHARLFGVPRREAAAVADRLLADVGLADRASSHIATYSRGMRQRLGIARALVNEPSVVFLDEPTLGLDPAGQRQILDIVRDATHRRGVTIVLCTHSLPEVEEVCTSVLILSRGRVLTSGTVREVTHSVASSRSALLRVPLDSVERARSALARLDVLTVATVQNRSDLLRISLTDGRTDVRREGMNEALRAVLAADVPVQSFDIEEARLSDAFLAITEDAAP